MNNKSSYRTKQKTELTYYLKEKSGEHITANEICEHFRSQGNPIGLTTVYRHLQRLVEEGLVNKYIVDKNSPACFEFVTKEAHTHDHICFHCKCEKCGKLIHLHCEELEKISIHLSEEHNFLMNPLRTVFYGVCEDCL